MDERSISFLARYDALVGARHIDASARIVGATLAMIGTDNPQSDEDRMQLLRERVDDILRDNRV